MDQAKLCTFFLQCYINFRDRPSAFRTGSAKIQYAISYLSGSALQYFEPAILGEVTPEPIWLRNWNVFKDKLQMNFGPYDNVAQAEIECYELEDGPRVYRGSVFSARTRLQLMCCATRRLLSSNFG